MSLSRRHLLGLALGAAASAGLTGCSVFGPDPESPAECVPKNALLPHRRLGGANLIYDENGSNNAFNFDEGFFGQLEAWSEFLLGETGWTAPNQIWTFGSWIDGGSECSSWHNAGRAFDLSRLRNGDDLLASARYDIWRTYTEADQVFHRLRYWTVAASLHHQFAHVLTYLYNRTHHNHLHIDNGRSGSELSTLRTGSRAQVQAVRAICRYIWQQPVELGDEWDQPTRDATSAVLDQIGMGGDLDDSDDHWRTFLRMSVREGSRLG